MSLTSRQIAYLLTGFSLLTLLILAFTTMAGLHDGDSTMHYFFSRYSWKYPEKLLDLWAKPFFTLVSSPFSQLGFKGIQVFNILCGVGGAYMAYRQAEWQGLRLAPLAIIYTVFMPVYMVNMPSGLTEFLFSLILITAVFLASKQQVVASSILVSFLPFVRSEGFLILPLFALFFLVDRKFLAIAFLAAGTLIYSIIGYFVFDDFLWVFTRNPYTGEAGIYGHGELLHFVRQSRAITGNPLNILFAVGILIGLYVAWRWIRNRFSERRDAVEILLVYGPAVVMIVAHSIFWWKGIFGSFGMLRVLAAVVPCMAIISVRGTELVLRPFFPFGKKFIYLLLALVVGYTVVRFQIISFIGAARYGEEKKLLSEASRWVEANGYAGQRIFFSHPLTPFFLDLDPWDPTVATELNGVDTANVSGGIVPGSVVVWESLLGPREVGIPADSITNPKYFEIRKTFTAGEPPENAFRVIVSERKKD